ncbi:MAG: hypothetical protein NTZ74_07225 [Chloroflexi bacterium]|nr:hypothetical protein [Chloroflexota bacterium]
MSHSISLIDTTSYRARSSGVAWINQQDGDSGKFNLPGVILPKLLNRPMSVSRPLLKTSKGYPARDGKIKKLLSAISIYQNGKERPFSSQGVPA